MADLGSEIAHFYRGRSVFITGGSGFIGKVLVEKLLRSCPELSHIYLLMRSKRGEEVRSRLDSIFNLELFDAIRQTQPSLFSKVSIIPGDITLPNLGISDDDASAVYDNVSVIFHVAATVRFDEPLKEATLKNIGGTQSVVRIAKKVKNLAALIHVSTAFAFCDRKSLDEILYPPPVDPEKFLSWLEWADEDFVNEITPQILGKRPNTYIYTKALAEAVIAKESAGLPTAIVRPSIVCCSLREPFPGWLDNLNGPAGLIAGASKGLIRTFQGDPGATAGFIPVDVLVNTMIAVSWKVSTNRGKEILVYNSTSTSFENPMRWQHLEDMLLRNMHKIPYKEVLWYPGGSLTKNGCYHRFRVLAYHYLPAYIIDAAGRLFGKKPHMVNIQKKIWKGMESLLFFANNEFHFTSEKTKDLYKQLGPRDRELFNFDISDISWPEYLDHCYIGVKTYIFKEPTSKTTNLNRIYVVKRMVDLFLYALILRCVWNWMPHKNLLYPLLDSSLQAMRLFSKPNP